MIYKTMGLKMGNGMMEKSNRKRSVLETGILQYQEVKGKKSINCGIWIKYLSILTSISSHIIYLLNEIVVRINVTVFIMCWAWCLGQSKGFIRREEEDGDDADKDGKSGGGSILVIVIIILLIAKRGCWKCRKGIICPIDLAVLIAGVLILGLSLIWTSQQPCWVHST